MRRVVQLSSISISSFYFLLYYTMATKKTAPVKKPIVKKVTAPKKPTMEQRLVKLENWLARNFPEEINLLREELGEVKRRHSYTPPYEVTCTHNDWGCINLTPSINYPHSEASVTTTNNPYPTRVSMQIKPKKRPKGVSATSGYMTIM